MIALRFTRPALVVCGVPLPWRDVAAAFLIVPVLLADLALLIALAVHS